MLNLSALKFFGPPPEKTPLQFFDKVSFGSQSRVDPFACVDFLVHIAYFYFIEVPVSNQEISLVVHITSEKKKYQPEFSWKTACFKRLFG